MTETLRANFDDSWVGEGIVASQAAAYRPGRSTAQDSPRPRIRTSTPTPTPSTRTTILDTETVMKILDTYSAIRTVMDRTPNPSAKLKADFDTAVALFSQLIFQYDKLSDESRYLVDMYALLSDLSLASRSTDSHYSVSSGFRYAPTSLGSSHLVEGRSAATICSKAYSRGQPTGWTRSKSSLLPPGPCALLSPLPPTDANTPRYTAKLPEIGSIYPWACTKVDVIAVLTLTTVKTVVFNQRSPVIASRHSLTARRLLPHSTTVNDHPIIAMAKASTPYPSASHGRPRRQIRLPLRYRESVYSHQRLSDIFGIAAAPGSPHLQPIQDCDSPMRDAKEEPDVPQIKIEAEAPMEIDAPGAEAQQVPPCPSPSGVDWSSAEPQQGSTGNSAQGSQNDLPDFIPRRRYERLERELRSEVEVHRSRFDSLKNRLDRLERSEQRLKKMLNRDRERLADKAVELEEALRTLEKLEEKLDQKNETIETLTRDLKRYRSWWLNEYYCLKVALSLARNPKDAGVQAMKESSHARYMTCAPAQPQRCHSQQVPCITPFHWETPHTAALNARRSESSDGWARVIHPTSLSTDSKVEGMEEEVIGYGGGKASISTHLNPVDKTQKAKGSRASSMSPSTLKPRLGTQVAGMAREDRGAASSARTGSCLYTNTVVNF
ncbi:hypothetical protein NMY22_g7801 [Coprinellus aureogranulatus]|nr:hypothetical protein NMY22_g7801 [Coprinellus aureogranulatus]